MEADETFDILFAHRPAVGPAQEARGDLRGGLRLGHFIAGFGDEDLAAIHAAPVVEDRLGDTSGGGEILLHQCRRHGEIGRERVEMPVGDRVGRQARLGAGVEVQAEQIA